MEKFTRIERVIAALYFIWFFFFFFMFIVAVDRPVYLNFWPFFAYVKHLLAVYDITEFAVYVGAPLVIFLICKLIWGVGYTKAEHHHHSGGSFFVAFLNERIRAEELLQKLNELQNLKVSNDYINELKADKEKASVRGANRWIDRLEIKKKYKKFEG